MTETLLQQVLVKLDALEDEVGGMRTDVAVLRTHMEYVRETMPADRMEARALGRRVDTLEAWRWRLVGAAAAAGIVGGPIWDAVIR